jgi:hypothetical protein
MTGWKTWVASAVAALSALLMMGQALLSDPFDPTKFYEGLMALAAAVGLVGIGHKIEKNKTQ